MMLKNISINPQVISEVGTGVSNLFDLHTLIYEQLSAMQSGWEMVVQKEPSSINDAEIILYHKSSKNPNLWYGFFIRQASTGRVYINPATGGLKTDGSINGYNYLSVSSLYDRDNVLSKRQIESLLTIGIGKNNKSCFISVTPQNSGYVLMNAISGEDTSGNVYAYSPSMKYEYDANPMRFSCRDESLSVHSLNVNWTTYTSSGDKYYDNNCMGTVMESDILALSPFVNPINGNICPDLFTPLMGPEISSRLYDVTINGRTFITGSSNSVASISNVLSDSEYNVTYKVFMEV